MRLRRAIALLSLVGLALAGYLIYVRTTGGTIACTTGGCETVQSSRYATLLGIPVAALGGAAYLGILASAIRRDELAAAAGVSLALVGVGFGGYLLVVQLAVIGAVCEWCLASDIVMSALAILTLLRLSVFPRNRSEAEPQHPRGAAPMALGSSGETLTSTARPKTQSLRPR
jgi:uncharacterized membrane protein